jgi:hypothetical protein
MQNRFSLTVHCANNATNVPVRGTHSLRRKHRFRRQSMKDLDKIVIESLPYGR